MFLRALSTHSGVCHSDLGIMMNSWRQLPFPTEPGQVRLNGMRVRQGQG